MAPKEKPNKGAAPQDPADEATPALPTVANLAELEEKYPQLASVFKFVITSEIKDVEHHLGDLPGTPEAVAKRGFDEPPKSKQELAAEGITTALGKLFQPQTPEELARAKKLVAEVYHVADEAFDFNALTDLSMALLLPLMVEGINWGVTLLHGLGVFQKSAGGVQ